ncbi:MAG: DUF5683 domain-containing protein [Chitinispirillaceae bacterium]
MGIVLKRRWILLSAVILHTQIASFAQEADTPFVQIPEGIQLYDTAQKMIPRYNPLKALGLSAVLPGAGQAYADAWLRGGVFLSAEIIAILVTVNRLDDLDFYDREVDTYDDLVRDLRDSTQAAPGDSLLRQDLRQLTDDRLLVRYERRMSRYGLYHAIGWSSGFYIWNLMDALGASNYFKGTEPKSPLVAGWLSAVPGLGLGQLYNRALSKAGMVWTVQTMLGVMAYDYHRLMKKAEDNREQYLPDGSVRDDPLRVRQWQGRYNDAFTRRNMYLWYSVFFYFYSVFDAVVDAHLHDYPRQIRFEPVVQSSGEKLGFQTVVHF